MPSHRSRIVIRTLSLLILPLVLFLPGSAQEESDEPIPFEVVELPPPSKRLWSLENIITHTLLKRDPWLAQERGWFEGRPGLGHYDPDWLVRWSSLLDSTITDLAAIRPYDLPERRRIDHTWLLAWVRAEAILVRSQAASRWNPVWYVERIRRVLLSILETTALEDEQRRALIIGALHGVPRILQTAVESLVAPTREFSKEAVYRSIDLLSFLQIGLAKEAGIADWPEKDRDQFETQTRKAQEAVEFFRGWLKQSPVQTGTVLSGVGKENWENIAAQLVGRKFDARNLRGSLLRDLVRYDRILIGKRVLKPTPQAFLETETLCKRFRTASRISMLAFGEKGLIDMAALPRLNLVVDVRHGQGIPREIVRASPEREFGYRLWIEASGMKWTPPVARTRSALLSPPSQDALAVRYGYPGESLLRSASAAHKSLLQRYLWNRATLEGWGLYAMNLVGRADSPVRSWKQAEGSEVALARILLLEVARLIATLELHVEGIDLEEVTLSFAARTGLDPTTSGFEVRHSMSDPLHGIGYLAFRELMDFERDLRDDAEPLNAIRTLISGLLERPTARVSDLRAIVEARAKR